MQSRASIIRPRYLEINVTKNSSKNPKRQNLASIPDSRAKKFLEDLVNMSDERIADEALAAVEAFERHYGDIIPIKWLLSEHRKTIEEIKAGPSAYYIDTRTMTHATPELRDALRAIWIAPDLRTKEWGTLNLIHRSIVHDDSFPNYGPLSVDVRNGSVEPLPPPTTFEICLRYMLRNASRTVVCANVECNEPYFFARRRSQKYCSEECALPAQRAFKREWWAKNGKEWRHRWETKR
jgi:hypothetical protein